MQLCKKEALEKLEEPADWKVPDRDSEIPKTLNTNVGTFQLDVRLNLLAFIFDVTCTTLSHKVIVMSCLPMIFEPYLTFLTCFGVGQRAWHLSMLLCGN